MATVRRWFDLPYGHYEDEDKNTLRICAMSHGLFSNAELLDVLLAAFCIMSSMRVPISGGISPC